MARKKNKSQKTIKEKVETPLTSHAKSGSIIKNIYTYSKKKPKRLGKNCLHFDKDKLSCKLYHQLCKGAEKCNNYTDNLEVLTHAHSSKNKALHKIGEVGITAIVLTDNRKCINNNHTITDINATLRIGKTKGQVIDYNILAAYCSICDTYFVLKKDFKIAKEEGVILCPVIDMTSKGMKKNTSNLSSSESRIHQLGYNVKKGNGYTQEQRQLILANILENTEISRHEIESCILRPMSQHKNQKNYAEAVLAWEQDLAFIKNYKLGDIPEVVISKIVIGKRMQ